ncbi:DMT family transporter [Streptomyces sp. NPDC020965]|uniref:DMT family transporter n=1 Tax=Streptomyces sp. NPDC020965 TaxID=3365105 RepID=UPI00379CB97C
MPWAILLISAVFEAVWATALGQSDGLSKTVPTVVFFIGLALSMAGLGYAMIRIPISVAYSVWIGIGAALTVIYAMLTGEEPTSALKVVFLGGIILCVIGLKFVKTKPGPKAEHQLPEAPNPR